MRRLSTAGALLLAAGLLSAVPRATRADVPALRNAQQPPTTPPAAATPAPIAAPNLPIERYTLPNGLEVILHEDHRTPTVSVNIWYHVGSKDEPRGRNGFAHLFEHLMFQGSRHVAEDTFFRTLEHAGATGINGTTGDDRTNYFETVPSGRLNLALWLESDRMAFLLDHVNQATFESQRAVVLNERRQSYENAPYGNVYFHLREALFPRSHPYHRLPIGTQEDLDAATLDDVRNFFRTWYVPNNATLVVAGDFQPAQARQLIEQYFGPITRGADVPRRPPPPAVQLQSETRIALEAGVELPRVYIAWPSPAYFQPGDAELDLVAGVLTIGRSSRLYRRLVHEAQIATSVEAAQDSMQLGSDFEVVVTGRPGQTPEALLSAVDEELGRLQREAPAPAEVERARTRTLTSLVFSTERSSSRADRFNFYNQLTGNPDSFARDLQRYQAPGPAEVSAAARRFLPLDRRVVVMVYPTPGAPRSGRLRAAAAPAANRTANPCAAPTAPAPSTTTQSSGGAQ